MSLEDSSLPYDEELLSSSRRVGAATVEDATMSVKYENSRYVHTSFLEVLLDCACARLVQNEVQRQLILSELCRRLSQSNFINEELLSHSSQLKKEVKKIFYDHIKNVCNDLFPDDVFDFSTLPFLEKKSMSFQNAYRNCFEELKEIGRGGFGVVCKVRHTMTDSLYAVKKIFFNYKNDSRLYRVIREAKNIAILNHPNVVRYNNAWTETPSPDDDFVVPDSDCSSDNSDNNSNGDKFICHLSNFSEDRNKMEENESFSSESTYLRSMKSNRYHFSSLNKTEYTSYSKVSDSVIFSDFPNSSNRNPRLSFEKDNANDSNLNFTREYYAEKDDSVAKSDLKKSHASHSNSDDSEKSDDSVKLNLRAVLYIQMEFCDCDLSHWLEARAKGNTLPFQMTVTEIFIDILNGLCHIHSKGIIHRDLKPANIFYSQASNCLKIGDFGLAKIVACPEDVPESNSSNIHSPNIGTIPYAAPEQIKGLSYDSKVDIYTIGIILIELLINSSTTMELIETIKEVKKGNLPNNMKQLPKLINLVKNLVNENPADRLSAKEIHSYLRDDIKNTTTEEMKISLQEKDRKLQLTEAALNERDEENKKLKEEIKLLKSMNRPKQ